MIDIFQHFDDEMDAHQEWLMEDFLINFLLPGMMMMTEQLSAVAMQQVLVIGMFLDAKHQQETQLLFQALQIQAHKDYHPSRSFCWFGTNVRSLANSDSLVRFNTVAMNQRAMARHLGKEGTSGAVSRERDKLARWNHFTQHYCDIHDNNWQGSDTGLELACPNAVGATPDAMDPNRRNRDLDYTRLIDEPRTLNIDFTDSALLEQNITETVNTDITDGILPGGFGNGEEEDVLAMANYLYGHDIITRSGKASPSGLRVKQNQHPYLKLRTIVAKRNVAENSFNHIVALKSRGTSDPVDPASDPRQPQTREYLARLLKELDMPDDEIYKFLGERPSYYAQMEVLAKRIYQNPDFYVHLLDKPANVKRKSVALKAIRLMLERAMFESQIRQEMMISVLLSTKLEGLFRDVNKDMASTMNESN